MARWLLIVCIAALAAASLESGGGKAAAAADLWARLRRAVFGGACPLAPGMLEPGALENVLTDRPPTPATQCQVCVCLVSHVTQAPTDFLSALQLAGIVGQHIASDLVPYLVVSEFFLSLFSPLLSQHRPPFLPAHLRDEAPRKPLVLAFVGTTGVGKTEFERQLRRAVFAGAHPDGLADGALVLSGNDYRDGAAAATLHRTLRDRVARQVWACPRSLIVVDEAQFVADGVLDALVDLLGFQQPVVVEPYGAIDFRRATVILTSMDGGVASLVRSNACLKR